MTAGPEFSVILPLERDHGQTRWSIRSWVRHQSLPSDQFEVIAVSRRPGDRHLRAIRRELGAQGRVVVGEANGEIDLFNMGAREARGRFLVFTETHGAGDANCLTNLHRLFQQHPEYAGARCCMTARAVNTLGALEDNVFQEDDLEVQQEGHWRKVLISGCVIERDLFLRSGGFDARYAMFAQLILAAHLNYKGYKLGYAGDARIEHFFDGDLDEVAWLSTQNVPQEIAYRASHDEEFCNHYFGEMTEWSCRGDYRADLAAALRSCLLGEATVADSPLSPEQLLAEAETWSMRADFGLQRELGEARLERRLSRLRLRLWRFAPERRERAMRDFRRSVAAYDRYRAIEAYLHPDEAPPYEACIDVAAYPAERMLGFLPTETWAVPRFRWTSPSAVIELPVAGDVAVIVLRHIAHRPARRDPSIVAYLDGRRLDPMPGCDPDERRFAIGPRGAGDGPRLCRLAILCDPYVPSIDGDSEDTRLLGIALSSIELLTA